MSSSYKHSRKNKNSVEVHAPRPCSILARPSAVEELTNKPLSPSSPRMSPLAPPCAGGIKGCSLFPLPYLSRPLYKKKALCDALSTFPLGSHKNLIRLPSTPLPSSTAEDKQRRGGRRTGITAPSSSLLQLVRVSLCCLSPAYVALDPSLPISTMPCLTVFLCLPRSASPPSPCPIMLLPPSLPSPSPKTKKEERQVVKDSRKTDDRPGSPCVSNESSLRANPGHVPQCGGTSLGRRRRDPSVAASH